MARVLFTAWGTRGDTQAAATLAAAVAGRAHEVELAAPGFLAAEADRLGVPFRSLGDDPQVWFDERPWWRRADPRVVMPALMRLFARQVDPQFTTLREAVGDADLVVGQGLSYAAPSVAEAAGVPYRYLSTNVFLLPSDEQPALGVNAERLPAWVNRLVWWQFSFLYNRLFRRRLNGWRRDLGLAPVADVVAHVFDPGCTIGLIDPELYPVPGDVELLVPPVGSLADPDGASSLDPGTEGFLAEDGPVVFVGFGSMPDRAPHRTTEVLVEAARQVGARLVLAAGWAGLGADVTAPDVHVVGDVAHHALFPQVDVVVHHGGVGTAATAGRAGKPQVVVPHAYDQNASARALVAAGVAPPALPKRKLTATRLAERLDQALNDEGLRARADGVGRAIRARDALATTVGLLEDALLS